jgi:predicted phosphodiesterase
MRILVASDLHLDSHANIRSESGIAAAVPCLPDPDTYDVIALAGDVANNCSLEGVLVLMDSWVATGKHIMYTYGNHELYSYPGGIDQWRKDAHNTCLPDNFHLLEAGKKVTIDGVTFQGDTMWTDLPAAHEAAVVRFLNDFDYISDLTPRKWRSMYQEARKILINPGPGKHVLVTHHGLSLKSIAPEYQRYTEANSGFTSDDEAVLDGHALHIHGHTHTGRDYTVDGGCRVVVNPRGYRGENSPSWTPIIVEVP